MANCFTLLILAVVSSATSTVGKEQCQSLMQVRSHKEQVQALRGERSLNRTETDFVAQVLTSFGMQATNYSGSQILRGFVAGQPLLDSRGMFAFDSSVKSVAIDVGAAANPLIFDMDRDASQMVLAFEPVFDKTLEEDMERAAKEVEGRGGCKHRWESFCVNQRLVVLPSAVSSEVGHAKIRLADNPYCSSLNSIPGGLDPTLVNSADREVRDVMASCWGSLEKAQVKEVPTVTLASILARIPDHIRVKYLKIDAQGQDFKVLLSAGEEMSRIEYVRFEIQDDPPQGRKMVADTPSYAEVESKMKDFGFVHEAGRACSFTPDSSPFSKAIQEKECVFCRELPCRENGMPPLGEDPRNIIEMM